MNLIYNLISKMGEEKMGEEEIREEEIRELEMREEETKFVKQLKNYIILLLLLLFNIYIKNHIRYFGSRGDYPWLPKISSLSGPKIEHTK
jgi:hypothetical protein